MKRILLLLFFVFIGVTAQAQKQRATMILRNGDTLQGLAKFISNERVKFRKHEDYPRRNYNYREVSEIFINKEGKTKHFQYKVVQREESYIKLVEVISQGRLNLYRVHKERTI